MTPKEAILASIAMIFVLTAICGYVLVILGYPFLLIWFIYSLFTGGFHA